MGKVLGNQRRLIETPSENPPAVGRDGNQNPRLVREPGQKQMRHQLGQSDFATMFEFQSNRACQSSIGHNCIDAVVIGWRLHTGRTDCNRRRDRSAASFTAPPAQQGKRLPASRAELQIGVHNLATASTSRGKGKGNDIREHITHNKPCCVATADAQDLIMMPPEIFDRTARSRLRERMQRYPIEDRWIIARMTQDILDRLDAVRTPFRKALVIGGNPVRLCESLSARSVSCVVADLGAPSNCGFSAIACHEDRLPFADGSFDLVVATGTLDTVSDLPGALVLIQRILSDNGLFIGAMMGAGSLPFLRSCLQRRGDGAAVAARFHPQIEVRGAGDLLARANFSLPVAESETLSARYRTLDRLIGDLRANGLTNCLAQRVPLKKAEYAKIAGQFSEPVVEQFSVVTLTGWARPRK